MKNTNKMLMMAACTLLLIMGTSIIPTQSYADRGDDKDEKGNDFKSKTSASYEADKKSASQDADQDNVCYRGNETCTQANQGQGLIGKDNDAVGFNDQSDNLALSSSSNGAGTTPTPTPRTCEECFTTILNSTQIDNLSGVFGDDIGGAREICFVLGNPGISETGFRTGLASAGIPEAKIIDLVKCLKESGIVFLT
jgi:hypothetical protein